MPSDYPAQIEVRSNEGQIVRYHLAPEFYARSSKVPPSPGERVVQRLDEGFAIFQVPASSSTVAEGSVLPVYRAQPSGMLAVATGRLWVRFAEGIDATQKREKVEKVGCSLEELPPWTARGAWVRASSGKAVDALAAAAVLAGLPGVEHVEPQMLLSSLRKGLR
ncbi:MAG: hypothetical protein DME50_04510 [Verrucomicrobia bacterium]|nr:MAG: hypothetical protein DME50_04510 [Verrucomicrobiota bacterium]